MSNASATTRGKTCATTYPCGELWLEGCPHIDPPSPLHQLWQQLNSFIFITLHRNPYFLHHTFCSLHHPASLPSLTLYPSQACRKRTQARLHRKKTMPPLILLVFLSKDLSLLFVRSSPNAAHFFQLCICFFFVAASGYLAMMGFF